MDEKQNELFEAARDIERIVEQAKEYGVKTVWLEDETGQPVEVLVDYLKYYGEMLRQKGESMQK